MADFDPQQVVDIVQFGGIPETWIFFPVLLGDFYFSGILSGLMAIIVWIMAPMIVFTNQATFVNSWFIFLMCALFGIPLMIEAWWHFRQIPLKRQQWVAVTPTGFVEYRGPTEQVTMSVAFADVSDIELRADGVGGDVVPGFALLFTYQFTPAALTLTAPRPLSWSIDPEYGPAERTGKTIIAAHARYAANRFAQWRDR